MKHILFISIIIFFIATSCSTENINSEPQNKMSENSVPIIQLNNSSISLNYVGTIDNLPARVRLIIKNGGQKIRTDIVTIDGNKKKKVSYWKINDEIFAKDYQTNVVSQSVLKAEDFIHFFYLPSEQFLQKSIKDKNLEIMENDSFLGENCSHFQMTTDSSHAEFHVWNNILLVINTEMQTGESIYKIDLKAVSLEKDLIPNDSLFVKPM